MKATSTPSVTGNSILPPAPVPSRASRFSLAFISNVGLIRRDVLTQGAAA
jgi:hypothetical protein